MYLPRLAAAWAVAVVALSAPLALGDETPQETPPSYYHDIRPILQESCQGCHQPARPDGKLDLTSVEAMLTGGESEGPAFEPEQPDDSLLVILCEDGSMPKEAEALPSESIALLRRWIEAGGKDDTPPTARTAFDPKHPPVYQAPPVVTSLDFSPDGSLLAVSGYHEVLLFRADGSALEARLVGLAERIESAIFSPDGARLAVTGGSPCRMGEVQAWDVAQRKLVLSHAVTFDTVYGASWSPDGKLIALGCSDNSCRAIDAASGKQVFFQLTHEDWVLDTVFSRDGSHLVSVSRDRSMRLSEVATQRFIDNITSITPGALKGGLMAVARHPEKDELLAGGADGAPKIYRMIREQARQIGDDFNLIRAFDPLVGRIFAVAYSRDGTRILAASSSDGQGEARVYQEADGKLVSRFQSPTCGLYAAAFRPDGAAVALGGFDGRVRLVNVETGELMTEFAAMPPAQP